METFSTLRGLFKRGEKKPTVVQVAVPMEPTARLATDPDDIRMLIELSVKEGTVFAAHPNTVHEHPLEANPIQQQPEISQHSRDGQIIFYADSPEGINGFLNAVMNEDESTQPNRRTLPPPRESSKLQPTGD